jgi:multiple sugar transport system ATP-binding protein
MRPEHLIMGVPATKNLPVDVDVVENLGNDSFISVRLSQTDNYLQVRVPPDKLVRPGEQLWLSLVTDKIHFFDPETELAIFPKSPYPSLPFEN